MVLKVYGFGEPQLTLSQLDDSDRAGYVFQAISKGLGRPGHTMPARPGHSRQGQTRLGQERPDRVIPDLDLALSTFT